MAKVRRRSEFFRRNPHARAHAALDDALNQSKKTTPGAVQVPPDHFRGKTAIVIGSGIGGLTTAYELLAQHSGMQVTILEAQNRTGGRCLSLRTGDTLTEDCDSELFGSTPGETQVIRFQRPNGDAEPYLNAGPGRIPSSHKRLLSYLQKFAVDVEVYVMNSESNLVQMEGGPVGNLPVVYRQLDHNTRGWLAQMVYENAESLLENSEHCHNNDSLEDCAEKLRSLMITFGDLNPSGELRGQYMDTAGQPGLENGRTRAGYSVLPGVSAGQVAEALSFNSLLDSEYWDKTRMYQPLDFLWQTTLFQPVGGMDHVQHAFAQQIATLGGTIHLNSPVHGIDWDPKKKKFIIEVLQVGTDQKRVFEADYCFCNAAMPFLKRMLSPRLFPASADATGFDTKFRVALNDVFEAQFSPSKATDGDYPERFLACTTKVGWQADRTAWQGRPIDTHAAPHDTNVKTVEPSEVGVVPLFGGISWTDDEITQIWYPSTAYHDQKGVLTGAYNFAEIAYEWGKLPIEERLRRAKAGATKFGKKFGQALHDGVAIAWQNMPYIKGGWAQWHVVKNAVPNFNTIAQGSGVYDADGKLSDPVFFIVGDQISSLPGWQEGAIASALNALSRVCRPDLEIPHLSHLADTRLMVEGV